MVKVIWVKLLKNRKKEKAYILKRRLKVLKLIESNIGSLIELALHQKDKKVDLLNDS